MIEFPEVQLPEEELVRDAAIIGVLLWWDELTHAQRLWVFGEAHKAAMARK